MDLNITTEAGAGNYENDFTQGAPVSVFAFILVPSKETFLQTLVDSLRNSGYPN